VPVRGTEPSPERVPGVVVSVVDEYPDRAPRHRPEGGTHREVGLAGTGNRYALIVAALVGLASLPTLAAVTAGTASLDAGIDRRLPFLGRGVEPPFVVIPEPYRPPAGVVPPPATVAPELTRPQPGEPRRATAAPRRGSAPPRRKPAEPPVQIRPPETVIAAPQRRPCRPRTGPPTRVLRVRWVRGPDASVRPPLFHQGR